MQGKRSSLLVGKLLKVWHFFFVLDTSVFSQGALSKCYILICKKRKYVKPQRPSWGEAASPRTPLSEGKIRIAVKMTLVLSISFADSYGYRLTRARTTWGTSPFVPPGARWDVWFIPAGWDRTIRLWKMDFKEISLIVSAWHSSGQLALCRNHHNRA